MKHEQIILVALGYIIGFVTAYIGFALSSDSSPRMHTEETLEEYGLVSNPEAAHSISEAAITNDGLFAVVGDTNRIVSASALRTDQSGPGFHYAVHEVLVSDDGKYLYYCVQGLPEHQTCDSYIYSVAADAIYPVKDTTANTYLSSEIATLTVSWSEGRLNVNDQISQSAAKPWMLE